MRKETGLVSFHAGRAAEECVERVYCADGAVIAARRWRGQGGEIDLIAREGDGVVFIEVKKSTTHAQAAHRLGPRQIARLMSAAAEYLETEPLGQLTPARFDVALVDSTGRVEILRNALAG